MSDALIDQIKADREAGTPGPWSAFTDDTGPHTNIVSPVPHTSCVFSLRGRDKRESDVSRIARVPDMEQRILSDAETLRTILSLLDSNASRDNIRRVVEAAIEGGGVIWQIENGKTVTCRPRK